MTATLVNLVTVQRRPQNEISVSDQNCFASNERTVTIVRTPIAAISEQPPKASVSKCRRKTSNVEKKAMKRSK